MQEYAKIPLAVVGMGCRLPGANSLDEYWQMLIEGKYPLGELPSDRLDRELYYDPQKGVCGKSYTVLGGISEQKPFDRNACPVPEDLLGRTHYIHLNLCEVAVDAVRDAGWDVSSLAGSRAGVYVGHTPPGMLSGDVTYAKMISQIVHFLDEIEGFDQLAGHEKAAIYEDVVNRVRAEFPSDDPRLDYILSAFQASAVISQTLGLDGPCMTFDAACASSLRALGHAARALQSGQIEMAIVGGASVCNTDALVLFSAAQSVSPTGSRPFDEGADGLVASEGYVTVILKTLERAVADGDNIQAVISGLGISSDGKGKSLWAPRREGQIEAMRRAYHPGIDPSRLQFVEAHATSTQVGDATELGALKEVFQQYLPEGKRLPVGSAKANVGHTLESAGLTSLIKTVLAMKHETIPPQINVRSLNKQVDWENLPFFVPTKPLPWNRHEDGHQRMAAVNAFGIGGLNVHIVLEEYVPNAPGRISFSKTLNCAESQKAIREPIAIIGMGAVLPGARTVETMWDLFHSEQNQKQEIPLARWGSNSDYDPSGRTPWTVSTRSAGQITDFEYDWKAHRVPPKQIQTADPLQFMLLDAAEQALHQAGYTEKEYDKKRTGVLVGTMFGGEFGDQLQAGLHLPQFTRTLTEVLQARGIPAEQIAPVTDAFRHYLLKRMPALVDETGSFTASTLASRITKTFDLMGGATAIDAGDASSMAALSCAVDLLRAGDCDMMICAAGQRALSFPQFELMNRHGKLAMGAPRGPFDADANGTVPAEGVGVVLLKRLSDARRDGDPIQGIIHGIGASRSDSLETAVANAVQRALEASELNADDVSFVETAATGIPERDRDEFNALASVYGTKSRRQPLYLGAAAGQLGHIQGGSGMVSLLKATSELDHVELPRIVDLAKPAVGDSTIAPVQQPTTPAVPREDGRLFAGVNCISQYNLAYHVLLERPTKVTSPKPAKTESTPSQVAKPSTPSQPVSRWRIVRFSAKTLAELKSLASSARSQASQHFQRANSETSFDNVNVQNRFRLAIVSENADELDKQLQLASQHLENPKARTLLNEKGIFIGEVGDRKPRLAYLFPGQGSQYTGMLRSLIVEFPPAASAHQMVDRVLASLNLPSFAELAWDEECPALSDVWRTQLSLIAADTIVHSAIKTLGFQADRVTGHSFGELAALTAADAWSFEEAVRATCGRCASIDACPGENGVMLSTSASPETLKPLCRAVGPQVTISHCNSPEQTVAGGPRESIFKLAEKVKDAGYLAKVLDVPAAFHTPLMDAVQEPFARALSQIPLDVPRIPLLSSVTNKYVADPLDIRENLVRQMTCPIDFVGLIQRLYDDGITVFVEVGPRQILSNLTRRILGDQPATIVACDHPKRNGVQQLMFAKAAVDVTGALDSSTETGTTLGQDEIPSSDEETTSFVTETETSTQDEVLTIREGIPVLELSGSAFEMGLQHGRALSESIRKVLRRYTDLAGTAWDRVVDLETLMSLPETFFGHEELEEFRGIAKGAGVTFSSVVAHNLRLYLDAGSGGLHFAVNSSANSGIGLVHAVNEDLRNGLSVMDCLERHVQIRKPKDGFAHIAFAVAGQVGTLNGINCHGLAVSTSVLLDANTVDLTENRRLHTVLVKQMLEQAANIDEALDILRKTQSTARWSLCLSHHPTDRLSYVEFDGHQLHIESTLPKVIAANHQLMKSVSENVPASSQYRLNRLQELLADSSSSAVSPHRAQEVLRDRFDMRLGKESERPTTNMVRRVDNQISIVMRPATGDLWLTPGPLANGHQNEFHRLNINELFNPLESPRSKTPVEQVPQSSVTGSAQGADSGVGQPPMISAREFAELAEQIKNERIQDGDRICHRFVMRLMESPRPTSPASRNVFQERCLILGRNPVGEALASHIESQGGTAVLLESKASPEDTITEIEATWSKGALPHLFVVTPFDANAKTTLENAHWNQRMQAGTLTPFLACQRWYQLLLEADLVNSGGVTAITSMGGDFGLSGNISDIGSGMLAGLLKDLHLEVGHKSQEQFRTKVIDFPGTESPESMIAHLNDELTRSADDVEIGYFQGKRYVPQPVFEAVSQPVANPVKSGGVWVVTGGARGITAEIAKEIGRRFQGRLHLIGSTALVDIPEKWHELSEAELKELRTNVIKEALANGQKPVDAWAKYEKAMEIDKTLREFASEGVSAIYHPCDVSNRNALEQVLNQIRQTDGPITGVVHGAGFERAGRFDKKKREFIERTFLPKLNGAAALMDLTRDDPLEVFIAFSSVAGRFGAVGQADYASANEMLGKLVDWYRLQRPETRSCSFYWHLWGDVGMAMRPETKGYFESLDMNFLPAREGVAHLIDEVASGLTEPEIVVTDWKLYRFHGLNDAASIPGLTPTDRKPAPATTQSQPASPAVSQHDIREFPMLDRLVQHIPGKQLTVEVDLNPLEDPFLAQHRYKQRPLMPLVATLETLAESAAFLAGPSKQVTSLRNIEILNGFRFPTDTRQVGRAHAVQRNRTIECRWTSDLHNRAGKLLLKDRPYLECTVEISEQPLMLTASVPSPRGTFHPIPYPQGENVVIYHGDDLRTLQDIAMEGAESWGRLIAPDPADLGGKRQGNRWLVSMSLLDGCFYAAGVALWFQEQGAVSVPARMEQLRLGRRLPKPGERCLVHVVNRGREENLATFDFTLFGEDNQILLQAVGHTMMIVAEGAGHVTG